MSVVEKPKSARSVNSFAKLVPVVCYLRIKERELEN
jgi:hypothetical protein